MIGWALAIERAAYHTASFCYRPSRSRTIRKMVTVHMVVRPTMRSGSNPKAARCASLSKLLLHGGGIIGVELCLFLVLGRELGKVKEQPQHLASEGCITSMPASGTRLKAHAARMASRQERPVGAHQLALEQVLEVRVRYSWSAFAQIEDGLAE
mmetsp:Transcript_4017/g.10447  ORF Transcript_4017/g.10447 Transcript_4017/m.10447 type:complete len:154 (-) Transcript_4017:458-919(-)